VVLGATSRRDDSTRHLARVVFATDDMDLVNRGVSAVSRVALEMTPDAFGALVHETIDGRLFIVEERLGPGRACATRRPAATS